MGTIQQGINQLLGAAAIRAKLSPELETKREIKNIDKQIELSGERVKSQTEYLKTKKDELSKEEIVEQLEISNEENKNITGLMKQKYKLNPSLGTYSGYSLSKTISGRSEEQLNNAKKILQAQQAEAEAEKRRGQIRAENKAKQQLEDQQRFEKFKEMFTEGGRYK